MFDKPKKPAVDLSTESPPDALPAPRPIAPKRVPEDRATILETLARKLVEHGSHAAACRTNTAGPCTCDWGMVLSEASAVLG